MSAPGGCACEFLSLPFTVEFPVSGFSVSRENALEIGTPHNRQLLASVDDVRAVVVSHLAN
jgi:hypothetical protein